MKKEEKMRPYKRKEHKASSFSLSRVSWEGILLKSHFLFQDAITILFKRKRSALGPTIDKRRKLGPNAYFFLLITRL